MTPQSVPSFSFAKDIAEPLGDLLGLIFPDFRFVSISFFASTSPAGEKWYNRLNGCFFPSGPSMWWSISFCWGRPCGSLVLKIWLPSFRILIIDLSFSCCDSNFWNASSSDSRQFSLSFKIPFSFALLEYCSNLKYTHKLVFTKTSTELLYPSVNNSYYILIFEVLFQLYTPYIQLPRGILLL